jgi:hypothetical protein
MVVALLLGLGFGVLMFALIAAISVPMQRYADRSGIYDGKRQAPLAKQLQLIAFICVGSGLGGGFMLAASDGVDWPKAAAYGVWALTLAATVLFAVRMQRSARPVRPAAGRHEIAHYTGVQRFFRCTIPRLMLDYGRGVAPAFAFPPTGIVLIAIGKTWFGVGTLMLGVIAWIVLLRLPARNPPRHGTCAPPS